MSFDHVYTSIACNRTPESADWGPDGRIVFAASHAIAVFDPSADGKSAQITQTYVEHRGRVNTVKWLSPTEFLSGSHDKTAILWDIADAAAPKIHRLIGHDAGITFVDAIRTNGKWLIATTSLDSTIRLWQPSSSGDAFETIDTISTGGGFCFALKFAILPKTKNSVVLAYSTDRNNVHLLCEQWVDGKRAFVRADTLAGHEDWVRGIDITPMDNGDLLIATASQDTFIRLWRIALRPNIESAPSKKVDIFTANESIQVQEQVFTVKADEKTLKFAVKLESVLLGHDNWIYGVHWARTASGRLQLLSSSIDKTMIVWAMQEDTGVWMERIRVGEVGGNGLGFYGGKFSPDARSIVGHGYQGSFHVWHEGDNENVWTPGIVVGGHFLEVRDLAWNPSGDFLLTVSADQTTRCHAPWTRQVDDHSKTTWHELARPQVHGYDMQTICPLSRFAFASGAEEKIVRTFQAPGNFVENYRSLCGVTDEEIDAYLKSMPKGASVPSLGLSNKAVYDESKPIAAADRHIKDQYPDNYFVAVSMEAPPTEETLVQNTLWAEVQKLYGHGYEVFALAATSDGKIVASTCRASNEEHAQIILWNTKTWKQIQKLASHQLTVTQLRFSPNDKWLLSASRDRRWSVFENCAAPADVAATDVASNFKLVATTDKKNGVHSRIIWTCDWSHDSRYFATGSRDGKIVAWAESATSSTTSLGKWHAHSAQEFGKSDSVTALAFAQSLAPNGTDYVAAVGLETGVIHVCTLNSAWSILLTIDQSSAHHLTVKRLQFRPSEQHRYQLASCGLDHLTRIYQIRFD